MSDLISRQAVLDKLKDFSDMYTLNEEAKVVLEAFVKIVTEQPTAYDVSKVVAEIKRKYCKKCRNILGAVGAEEYCKEQKCEIDELCDIVKRGGVE